MSTDATPDSTLKTSPPMNPSVAIQFLLLLDAGVRLLIWSGAAAITLFIAARYDLWTWHAWSDLHSFAAAWALSQRLGHFVMIFNAAYLLELAALRLLIPRPKPGRYSLAGKRPDVNLLCSCLLAVLTKARYQAPFPAFLVPMLANVAPFRWLLGATLGPRSGSPFFVEPNILDPFNVTIGRNVTIGFGSIIAGHLQERDAVLIAPTVIEDDVLIGANVGIPGNVHIKRGAVVRGFSSLLPGTVIGENEYWAGIPARRVRELKDAAAAPAATE